nr:MAG TPA: portal protein [Crassvirales sp.]
MLPISKKTKEWRKSCLLWANQKAFFNYSLVRKSVIHKKINYDLLNGRLHMSDLELVLNPDQIKAGYIPDRVQHYPIMNSKLNVLRGEEAKRVFDYRVIVTNPNAISEIEDNKKNELLQRLQEAISDTNLSEDEFNLKMEELNDYYTYEWQDIREVRANELLNHYVKEYDIPLLFNNGFMDALAVGEEMYQVDIVGGEPVIDRLNPLKVRIFKSGYSNKVEDADMIILEDYWSPGRVIDTFYDVLSPKDIKYIETVPDYIGQGAVDGMDNIDERYGFVNANMIGDEITISNGTYFFDPANLFTEGIANSLLPYDLAGNLRVLRLYWKSKKKILKVKSYDPETGEEVYNFYPETYVVDKDNGEEAQSFWVNEAWEGTMIGNEIFVNMRPRLVQYNRLNNPSRCHFGIIGSIYNLNDSRPFSLVDMMKPYNYMYDAIHDRLNKALASNWGSILEMDLSKIPAGWDVDKWMYYAKVNHIAVIDSFREGTIGASTGKLAGGLNNAGKGMIETNIGNYIQQQVNYLEFIKMEMAEVAGISKQREGQVSSRETVGGVERATLQSSHITEWLFTIHDDVKKRVLEAFLETAKIALKGRNMKFQYILSDTSTKVMEIEGDEFAEADYGLVVDNSQGTQELQQKLDVLAQAALQTQALSFSTITKLYTSASLAQKQRLIEKDEREIRERQQQAQQQQLESQQQIAQMQMQQKQAELDQKEEANIRDNQTKIIIAQIQSGSDEEDGIVIDDYSPEAKAALQEKIREFDERLKLDRERLELDKQKAKDDVRLKKESLDKKISSKVNK